MKERDMSENQQDRELRKEAYWEEHAQERQRLLDEKDHIIRQIMKSQLERDAVPGKEDMDDMEDRIRDLRRKMRGMDLFRGEEKARMQEEIDSMRRDIEIIYKSIAPKMNMITERIGLLNARLAQIKEELDRDR